MSNAIYASIARQDGLMKEMQVVANNLANASTTGYKSDRAVFAEYLVSTGSQSESLSIGGLAGHAYQMEQGGLAFTGGQFDVAIEGDGFFVVETPNGPRLTRAGHFQPSSEGTLIDGSGNAVLGEGGNPITIPEDATQISISADGAISVNGELIDRLGVVSANGFLQRDSNTYFSAPDGFVIGAAATIVQGALEQSNVSPVLEVARMIEVQRAYETGQSLMEREDQRISQLINAVRQG